MKILRQALAALVAVSPAVAHDCTYRHTPDPGLDAFRAMLVRAYGEEVIADGGALDDHPGLRHLGPLVQAASNSARVGVCPVIPDPDLNSQPPGIHPVPILDSPAGWQTANTHLHLQGCVSPCDDPNPSFPPEVDPAFRPTRTPEHLVELMRVLGVRYGHNLIWQRNGDPHLNPTELVEHFIESPYFGIGGELPASETDSSVELRSALEISSFSAAKWGHIVALGIAQEDHEIFSFYDGPYPFDPATAPNPYAWDRETVKVLQLGTPLPAPDKEFYNDGTGTFTRPLLEYFQEVGAVTGWAHQGWPVDLLADPAQGGFDWTAVPGFGTYALVTPPNSGLAFPKLAFRADSSIPEPLTRDILQPVFAPVDVLFGNVDFLEAARLSADIEAADPLEQRWFGLYYRLLDAGQRVGISGGSDYPCLIDTASFQDEIYFQPRTFARLEGNSDTAANWLSALEAGRTTIASGAYQFLGLEVLAPDGNVYREGDVVRLSSSQPWVIARPIYRARPWSIAGVPAPLSGTIEVLLDGKVAMNDLRLPATVPFDVPHDVDEYELPDTPILVPVEQSGWLAARSGYSGEFVDAVVNTHTAAVHVLIDDAPAADADACEYLALYCDYVEHKITELEAFAAESADPGIIQHLAGTAADRAAMRSYLAAGREAFLALRDFDLPPPPNVTRVVDAPSFFAPGTRPIGIVTADDPLADYPAEPARIKLRCFNAPAGAALWLARDIKVQPAPVSLTLAGRTSDEIVWVEDPAAVGPIFANAAGYAEIEIEIPVPDPPSTLPLHFQFIAFEPPTLAWTSSGVTTLQVPGIP